MFLRSWSCLSWWSCMLSFSKRKNRSKKRNVVYQLQFIEENNFSYDKNKKPISNLVDQIKYKTPLSKPESLFKFGARIKKKS